MGAALSLGSLVDGKYVVEGEIGSGGTAVVVRAKHVQLDQRVAIKYLKPHGISIPGVVERFLREARLAAKIKGDHAARIYDVGTLPDGTPFMVMEYLEGRDLERVLEAGPLSVEDTVDYVLQACEALAEAHAMGIVHRDLKPGNLFLARRAGGSSIVKILDFGISKVVADGRLEAGEPRTKHVTQVNDRFGTPEFMSPEQLTSASTVDARTDIWSLGVSLYELVTGKLPFEGNDMPQLCVSIMTREPSPIRVAYPEASSKVGALEPIVRRCLEKHRDDRYRNVAELARDLGKLAPEARPRIEHIARVIREAGEHTTPGLLDENGALRPPRLRTLSSWVETIGGGHGHRARWLAYGFLLALALAAVGAYVLRVRPRLQAANAASSAVAAAAPAAPESSASAGPVASVADQAPAASAAPPDVAASAVASATPARPPRTGKTSPTRRSTTPSDPLKKKHAELGDRE